MHALGLEFGSAAQLSKRPGSVWNCLWGNALKRSLGIIRKSRLSYPGPRFLSSATWPSLPKKHYNGLNQAKPNQIGSIKSGLFLRWVTPDTWKQVVVASILAPSLYNVTRLDIMSRGCGVAFQCGRTVKLGTPATCQHQYFVMIWPQPQKAI